MSAPVPSGSARLRWWQRWQVVAAVVTIVLVGAGVAAWFVWLRPDTTEPAADPVLPALSQPEADLLSEELGAQDPAVVTDALAEEVREQFAAAPAPLLPAGSSLQIDAATFEQGEDGYAAVQATSPGPPPATFVLYLSYEEGQWRLVSSVQQ